MKWIYIGIIALFTTAMSILIGGCSGSPDPFSYGPRSGGSSTSTDISTSVTRTYAGDVYPILTARCLACHTSGGSAGSTGFVLSNDSGADYTMVSSFVSTGDPDASSLLQKASGATVHGGSGLLAKTSTEYQTIAAWIVQGALKQ